MSLVLLYLLLNKAQRTRPSNKMFIHQCFFVIVFFICILHSELKVGPRSRL